MNHRTPLAFATAMLSVGSIAHADTTYSWRYYRTGNTGIQGDANEAVWVAPDGDPYIGGYLPAWEEGGFAKFVQSEDRWINFSNVDYPIMGHPENVGTTRVTDFVPETGDGSSGKVWIATWRGALRFDPAVGAISLERFGPSNSLLVDEVVSDADAAPDGTIWFVNQGIVRYNPASDEWTRWNFGNVVLAVQPKPQGGYRVVSSALAPMQDFTFTFDSDTQQWTTQTYVPSGPAGQLVGLPGAPFGGQPQWGGMPHAGVADVEVKLLAGGYELWMSCPSRGIAVLTVQTPSLLGDLDGDGSINAADLGIRLAAWS